MRAVSMRDVAEAGGVSKNTVSLALRNDPQIPPSTRRRLREIAEKLGYRKNPVVGHLMAQLRASAASGPKATLAILNANADPQAFMRHATIPTYVEGCRRRAAQQGYGLDEFWLGNPQLDGARLHRVLSARGIRGALIVGLMNDHRLPGRFDVIWQNYACVVTGVRTREPALSFACADHHGLALRAVENALRLGYRRPALVLDARIDQLIEGRLSAGVQIAQRELPASRRLAPFYDAAGSRRREQAFREWYACARPDVILTLYHTVAAWVKRLGLVVPRDLGLIQLEWRADHARWAGMNQHNDLVGEAAVDMVVGMIHNGESGIPLSPRATLIDGAWTDGETVRRTTPASIPNRA